MLDVTGQLKQFVWGRTSRGGVHSGSNHRNNAQSMLFVVHLVVVTKMYRFALALKDLNRELKKIGNWEITQVGV